jgi:phosphonate transport system permease protein
VTALLAEGLRSARPVEPAPPRRPAGRGPRRLLVALLVAGTLWSLHGAGVGSRPVANPAGWPQVRAFLEAALRPEADPAFLLLVAQAALVTAAYAVLGCAVALVVGVVLGGLLSRSVWRGERRTGARGFAAARATAALPRGLHEAVWALLLVNVLGLDPLVAILAIGLPYGAVTAKVFGDLLDETPPQAYRALLAAGAGRPRALAYGLLPLASADLLSYAFYRLECAVRSAVVLGIVGAGGLGFELSLSFSALRYGEMWTVLYALVLLCAATDLAGSALRRRLSAPRARSRRDARGRLRPARDRVLPATAAACLGLAGWAWAYLDVRPATLWSGRAQEQGRLVAVAAWPPRHDPELLRELAGLTVQTFQMSLLASVLSTAAGMALSVVAARPSAARPGPVRLGAHLLARAVLLLCRAVPPPVWALLVLFVLYPGLLPGALALAAYNTGVLGRLMAEGQDALPPAPTRALTAQGAPRLAAWLYGVLPRALPKDLAYGLYRWEVAARETVLVGLVGAGGLGQLLARQTAGFDWPGVVSTLLALVLLTLVVDLLSGAARRICR